MIRMWPWRCFVVLLLLTPGFLFSSPAAAQIDAPVTVLEASPVPELSPPKKPSFWKEKFRYSGELRQETAYRFHSEPGFSKIRQFAKMDLRFNFNETYTLKIGGRGWYDFAYTVSDHYPTNVKDQMREELALRDAYLDIKTKKVNIRLGHQQIVWGEALGQFFADVVTPKDLREFFLPDFDFVRLPIWALDVQVQFAPSANLELVLSPDQSVNILALPGADFAFRIPPPPPGVEQFLLADDKPETDFKHWNGGARISYLVNGWDLAWLYYTSPAHLPAIFVTVGVNPNTGNTVAVLVPEHHRVQHFGMTFSKGIKSNILRGEFVYTTGAFFNTNTPTVNQGVVQKNILRYVLGFDSSLGGKVDMNAEFQQQVIFGSTLDLANPVLQSYVFLHFDTGFFDEKLEPEIIYIVDVLHGDMQISPRIHYNVTPAITLTWGTDVFLGPITTLYGEFKNSDRVFMNTSWKF